MEKNMYSLILMDDVVKAADRLAHEKGTSRSNLINRILAERLAVMTPEVCAARIFEEAARTVAEREELQPLPPSGSMLTVRSVLPYKYNPTIKFSIELDEVGEDECAGEFRVVSRSQSKGLLSKLTVFFELWSQIETTCFGERFPEARLRHGISGGRFRRSLRARPNGCALNTGRIGEAVGQYVLLLQRAMTLYFHAQFGVDMKVFSDMTELYREYLAESPAVI